MNSYSVGTTATLSVTIRDTNNNLVDPTTLTLTVTRPDNVQDVYTVAAGQIIRDSLGTYHFNYAVNYVGFYTYSFVSTGPGAGTSPLTPFQGTAVTVAGLSSPTFQQLQDQVNDALHGNTQDLEQRTTLSATIDANATQFTVSDASQLTTGVIQIDSETMWVKSIDRTNNIVYLEPWGRGFRSSSAASHTSNTAVINNPRFPAHAIQQAIQQTIGGVYPSLFQVKTDESQTAVAVRLSYPVPADCDVVLDVSWKTVGPSELWQPVRRWKLRPSADPDMFSTGKAIDIADGMVPGRTIKVTYIAAPSQLVNATDTLSSTGLDDSVADVLVYGACWRLMASLENARTQTTAVEQSTRDQFVPAGAAANASKYYYLLYTQRLQQEADKLRKLHPLRPHLNR